VTERIYSLDTLKGISLLLVFFIHARFKYLGGPALVEAVSFTLLTVSRLAVPLFFLTSGYLLRMKLESLEISKQQEYVKKFLKKVASGYIIGTVVFTILKISSAYSNRLLDLEIIDRTININFSAQEIIFELFYAGKLGGGHLWFLPALFYSIVLIYIAYRFDRLKQLLAVSLVLHSVGILSRSYLIMDYIPVPRNDALFFGLAFTCIGFYVNKKESWISEEVSGLLKLAIFINVIHLFERAALSVFYTAHEPYFWGSYSFLTAPAAISVFLYFLKRKELGKNSRFNRYGKNTLWIYITHPIPIGILIGAVAAVDQILGTGMMNGIIAAIAVTVISYFGYSELILTYNKGKIEDVLHRIKSRT
jgi:surface polysaccharide O-acyltransferase-like enzyme